jgi:hypothetical protein
MNSAIGSSRFRWPRRQPKHLRHGAPMRLLSETVSNAELCRCARLPTCRLNDSPGAGCRGRPAMRSQHDVTPCAFAGKPQRGRPVPAVVPHRGRYAVRPTRWLARTGVRAAVCVGRRPSPCWRTPHRNSGLRRRRGRFHPTAGGVCNPPGVHRRHRSSLAASSLECSAQ